MIKRIGDIILIQLSDMDSNIYLLGDTAIDSGTGFNFTRLREIFRILKREMKSITQVINTHGHFDHVGGNGYFLNARVAIHASDADILEKGDRELSAADFFNGNLNPNPVNRRLEDGETIQAGPYELQVIHTPGHTHGSVSLFEKKKGLLFTGDTVFKDGIGRIDFPNSNEEQMIDSMEKLKALTGVKQCLPGHGEAFDKKALDKMVEVSENYF